VKVVKVVKPVKSPPPSEGRGGEVTAWQPEAPPPLPPDVRHVCPRCGGEAEVVRARAQCLRCLLIFSPPHLPPWVVRALWEGAALDMGAQGGGRPQGGLPQTVQEARR
jgi:hypothetical protein